MHQPLQRPSSGAPDEFEKTVLSAILGLMHELSVTQGILHLALEAARGAGHIVAIDLLVGELTSFVDDSIQFYFDILGKGTAAEGALVRIRREPASAACGQCGHSFRVAAPLPPGCPACGSTHLRITGGSALRVESIEVEDGDSSRKTDSQR